MGKMLEATAIGRGHEIVSIIDADNTDDFDSEAFRSAEVALEFTTPQTAVDNIKRSWAADVKVVCGTTGWTSEDGSLIAAAERLHLTQPALSHCIRKLEDQLGTPIWHREGRNLRPTQAGLYLLGVANRLLPQLQHAEERLRQSAKIGRASCRERV